LRQLPERYVHGARQMAGGKLRILAYIDEQRTLATLQQLVQLRSREPSHAFWGHSLSCHVSWLRNGWRIAANGAIAPPLYPKLREAHRERIIGQQAPGERLTDAGDQLDGLGRLERTQHAGQHSKDPGLGTVGHHAIPALRENAAIAGALTRYIGHEVTFETMDGCRHQRPAQNHAGIIDEVTRCEA